MTGVPPKFTVIIAVRNGAQTLQRARDVDPFATGEREPLAGAVPVPGMEARNGQRPVERRVHRHGDDHVIQLQTLLAV